MSSKIVRMYRNFRSISKDLKELNISAHAASTAFFLFLSLVPMLVMICTIIPYTPLTETHLVGAVTEITPGVADALAKGLIAEVYEKSAGILSIAVIAMLWSAGKGVLALRRGLNAINGDGEKRNYLVVRMIASFYTLVMLVLLILSLFVTVFGNRVVEMALYRLPQLQSVVAFAMQFRFLAVWGILTLFFAAIYAYVPDNKLQYKKQIPGALFTSVMWSVFSFFFALYVDGEGAFSIYGSISIIVIVMLWMYFCMYLLLVGAYLNRWYEKRWHKKTLQIEIP